jgi:hypothetical protein
MTLEIMTFRLMSNFLNSGFCFYIEVLIQISFFFNLGLHFLTFTKILQPRLKKIFHQLYSHQQ